MGAICTSLWIGRRQGRQHVDGRRAERAFTESATCHDQDTHSRQTSSAREHGEVKISRVLFSLLAANRCGEFRWFSRETILGAMAMLDQLEVPWRPSGVSRSAYGGARAARASVSVRAEKAVTSNKIGCAQPSLAGRKASGSSEARLRCAGSWRRKPEVRDGMHPRELRRNRPSITTIGRGRTSSHGTSRRFVRRTSQPRER